MVDFVSDPALIAELEAKSASSSPKTITDPELIKALEAKHSATASGVSAKESGGWGSYIKGLVRSAAKGATFNWSDEIEALARSAFSGDYEMALAKVRDEVDAFKKENPKTALAAELGGAFAIPGLGTVRGVASVMRSAPVVGRMAVGGAVGATESAIAGAGDAEGARLQGARDALAPGAVIGAAIPAAGAALKPVGRAIAAAVPESAPVVGRLARETSDRAAMERVERALRDDAELSGQTFERHLRGIRNDLIQDQQSGRGTNNASLLSAASNTSAGGARFGENIAELAENTGTRSNEAQSHFRRYAREAEDALPGRAHYEQALYQRGVAQGQHGADIATLMGQSAQLRRIERDARHELQTRGSQIPPPGQYNPELLDFIDRHLQRANANYPRGGGSNTIAGVRDILRAMTTRAFPTNYQSRSLEDLKHQTGVGHDQIRKAEAAFGIEGTRARERVVDEAVRAGSAVVAGRPHLAAFGAGRTLMRIVRGDLDRGEALARILTQRVGRPGSRDAQEITRIMNALEDMPAHARERYIDALIAMGSQQVGANVAE